MKGKCPDRREPRSSAARRVSCRAASTSAAPAAADTAGTPVARHGAADVADGDRAHGARCSPSATAYGALTEKLDPLESIVVDERHALPGRVCADPRARRRRRTGGAGDRHAAHAGARGRGRPLRRAARGQGTQRDRGALAGAAVADHAHRRGRASRRAQLREDVEARIRQMEAAIARDRERHGLLTREIDARQQELVGVQRQFDAAARSPS